MNDLITIDIDAHVADVRLNRADKANALSIEMFDAIVDAIDRLRGEHALRAVVLSGVGKHFCAGADVGAIQAGGGSGNRASLVPRYGNEASNRFQYVSCGWRELSVPVIAAVHGVAYGGGFQLALGADLRYATEDARMCAMEINWGLIPDMGISQTLRGLVREDIARELLYSGRVVAAPEALAMGLITRICDDPRDAALAMAAEIAAKNPDAIRATKRLVNESWHVGDAASGLLLESELQQELSGYPNQVEAVAARIAGRDPIFADPS